MREIFSLQSFPAIESKVKIHLSPEDLCFQQVDKVRHIFYYFRVAYFQVVIEVLKNVHNGISCFGSTFLSNLRRRAGVEVRRVSKRKENIKIVTYCFCCCFLMPFGQAKLVNQINSIKGEGLIHSFEEHCVTKRVTF